MTPEPTSMTPAGYEEKFSDFIRMCSEAKAQGVEVVLVATPGVLGDDYGEVMESLSRLADAGLALRVAARNAP